MAILLTYGIVQQVDAHLILVLCFDCGFHNEKRFCSPYLQNPFHGVPAGHSPQAYFHSIEAPYGHRTGIAAYLEQRRKAALFVTDGKRLPVTAFAQDMDVQPHGRASCISISRGSMSIIISI